MASWARLCGAQSAHELRDSFASCKAAKKRGNLVESRLEGREFVETSLNSSVNKHPLVIGAISTTQSAKKAARKKLWPLASASNETLLVWPSWYFGEWTLSRPPSCPNCTGIPKITLANAPRRINKNYVNKLYRAIVNTIQMFTGFIWVVGAPIFEVASCFVEYKFVQY